MAGNGKAENTTCFDPRTLLLLLILVNVVVFLQNSFYVELTLLVLLMGLFLYCRLFGSGLKFALVFGFLLALQYYIFPVAPQIFADFFSILTAFLRRVFPILMIGSLIVKTTPMRHFVLAMRKWRLPEKLVIPLSVTIRYFPAIREEIRHIRDAMKLRRITGAAKFEAYIVPLIFSAANTADELSAAAVTRGIENPAPKTSVIELCFSFRDYICIVSGLVFALIAFWLR
jgi:energy-coupling factor transport system permease protein